MFYRVVGNSMYPLIKNDDTIKLYPVTSLKKGDIITVKNCFKRVITHRLIDEDSLITKGDNSVFPEKSLKGTSHQLIGKVRYVITPDGKRFNPNRYSRLFFQYSYFEMKFFEILKKVIPFTSIIIFIRQVFYFVFIFIFKLVVWRT